MLVVDASVLFAFLVEPGPAGVWARTELRNEELAAPSLIFYEVANVLRKKCENDRPLTNEEASLAHQHLLSLKMTIVPYRPLAPRVWELRRNLTSMDASYVALAEALQAPLVTLDGRAARAPGLRCEFRVFTELEADP